MDVAGQPPQQPTATGRAIIQMLLFTRLVEIGFIGTVGTTTDIVHQQVTHSLNGQKALVAATLSGDGPLQSKRNSERRS